MSVAIFIITHQGIGSNLLSIGESIIHQHVDNLCCQEIPMDSSVDKMIDEIDAKLSHLNTGEGLLIITDIYGSTPGNIAQKIANKHHAQLLSGINLPMIIRLLNYRDKPLQTLTDKALDGAVQGIQQHD